MVVTLEDCAIWSESNGWKDFRNIVFSLPGMMNLYGIKEEINNYQIGHERFENKHGVLYVACDFCARYAPKENGIREIGNGYKFRSLHGLPEFKGRDFTIFDIINDEAMPIESDKKAEIIGRIDRHPNMRQYIDSFFNWLNESIRTHGERFYKS